MYLIDWLLEAGPDMPGAMGATPLSWTEIDAWARLTGREVAPWEAELLRHLSIAFVQQYQEAKAIDCPPPWLEKPTDITRDRVSRQLAAAFARRKPRTPPVPANVSPHEAGTGPGGKE